MFIFFELVVALNCRSLKYSIFKVKPHKILSLAVIGSAISTVILFLIPQLRSAFELVMPTLTDIMWAAILSILPIILIETLKMRFRKSGKIQQNIET